MCRTGQRTFVHHGEADNCRQLLTQGKTCMECYTPTIPGTMKESRGHSILGRRRYLCNRYGARSCTLSQPQSHQCLVFDEFSRGWVYGYEVGLGDGHQGNSDPRFWVWFEVRKRQNVLVSAVDSWFWASFERSTWRVKETKKGKHILSIFHFYLTK